MVNVNPNIVTIILVYVNYSYWNVMYLCWYRYINITKLHVIESQNKMNPYIHYTMTTHIKHTTKRQLRFEDT